MRITPAAHAAGVLQKGINMELTIMIYLVGVNALGLALMGIDKARAVRHAWRISEKALFLVAIAGGSVGAWAGMYLFHHKTRHWYFVIGMPAILALQVMIGVFFLGKVLPRIALF